MMFIALFDYQTRVSWFRKNLGIPSNVDLSLAALRSISSWKWDPLHPHINLIDSNGKHWSITKGYDGRLFFIRLSE